MTLALIDADHIVWRCAGSCEPTKAKPYRESKEDALVRAEQLMQNIVFSLNDPQLEVYISGEGNWRYAIYPEYKANRKGKPIPMWLEDVREYLLTRWNAQLVNGMEVDDMCGIRMTQEEHAICVSLDKDLLTVPGEHYNFANQNRCYISPWEAQVRFYSQLLTGDASDNIPAFDGKFRTSVPQFVQKLLDPLTEMEEEVDMYEYVKDIWISTADCFAGDAPIVSLMHRNAQCLYILRKDGEYWLPPNGVQEENNLL